MSPKSPPASPGAAQPTARGWPRPVGWLLPALGLVLASWFAFMPAFHGTWIWDDFAELVHAPEIRDPAGLGKIWFAPEGVDYFPLKTTVQWLQWHLWQEHVLGYHVSNVALHLLSAFLFWHLLRKLGLRLAWLGGLLFAVHPVVVESVAWMAELKNTLSLPPLLLAMGAYVDYDARRRRADYRRALLLFVVAMLCKTSVVMLPVVILLYVWWKRGRITKDDLKASAPFFAVSLMLGLVTVWFQHQRAIGEGVILVSGVGARLAGAGLAVAFYVGKCVWPVDLLPIYPRWTVEPPSFLQFLPWLGIAVGLGWLWAKRATWGRHALFGCGFFLINLAPVLGFITMSYLHIAWVADHFVYLPLLGLIGLATAGAATGIGRLAVPLRPYAIGGAVAVGALLACQSHRYAGIFRDEETFWTYTLQHNPRAWVAHGNLGKAALDLGRVEEAIGHFEAALRLKPDYAAAHYNWGNALVQQRQLPVAVAHYEAALRLMPDYADAHINLGNTLVMLGRAVEAAGHYEAALRVTPNNAGAHYNLGKIMARLGRWQEAAERFETALRLNPGFVAAHVGRGDALIRLGRLPEAVGHYEAALQLEPGLAVAHYDLACVLLQTERVAEAVAHFETALRLKPDYAEAHNDLGYALVQLGRPAEAMAHFEAALRFKPDYPEAHTNIGNVLFQSGRLTEALARYQTALRINPDYADARCNAGLALFQLGRMQEAKRYFESALRLNPDDAQARDYLNRLQTLGPTPGN